MSPTKKKSRQRLNRLKKNAKRLVAYSAVAAATVVTTQDRSAEAEEVIHDIPDVTVGPASLDGVVFNMVAGTATTVTVGATFTTPGAFRLIGAYGGYPNPYIYTPAYSTNGGFVGTGASAASLLGTGAMIGPSQNFVREVSAPYPNYGYYANLGNWSVGQSGFVGIRFDLADGLHYGWAEITRDASNVVTLHSFGYNDTPDEPTVTPADVPVTIAPDSVTTTRGQYVAGDAASLAESDNVDYQLRRAIADTQSRTEFEVKSTSPTATPTVFEFTLEGAVFARSNVVQTIELFDYVAGDWELVHTSDAARSPSPDSVVTATPTGDLSRFVEAGTMCIEARVHFQSDSPRQRFASNTDQAVWTIQ